jgi:RNA polymerase sigma-70 factor (ECF subfamily)
VLLPHAPGTSPELARVTSDGHPVSVVRPVPLPSFDQVYERHFRFVWRVLRASGLPSSMVEDAAQDVFVVVHRKLEEFEGRSDIRTWLFRIARWVVSGERRRLRTKPEHEPLDDELSDVSAGPFEEAARNEAIRTLERILSRMDPEKRMAFLLMDIEEMKATEVAELLEINVNTAYSRLRLAREQFKLLLQESSDAPKGSES